MAKLKNKQSQGLGDTIAKITEATGIDKIVNAVTDDCGCNERREKLNKLFSYKLKVVNCPNEEDVNWYKDFKANIKNKDQYVKLGKLYANVFNVPYFEPCTNCSLEPYISMIDKLDKIIT